MSPFIFVYYPNLISTLYFFILITQQQQSPNLSHSPFSLSFFLTLPYFSPYGSTSNLSVFYFFPALAWVVSYINILHVLSRRHKNAKVSPHIKRFFFRTPCSLQVSKVSFMQYISFRKIGPTNESNNDDDNLQKRLTHKKCKKDRFPINISIQHRKYFYLIISCDVKAY